VLVLTRNVLATVASGFDPCFARLKNLDHFWTYFLR